MKVLYCIVIAMLMPVQSLYAASKLISPTRFYPCRLSLRSFYWSKLHCRNHIDDYDTTNECITSGSNGKIKLLKSLKQKKNRDELGLVLVEGHRMVIDCLKSGLEPKLIVWTDKAFQAPLGQRLSSLFEELNRDVPIYVASDSVLSTISNTVNSQGVIAAMYKPTSPTSTGTTFDSSVPISLLDFFQANKQIEESSSTNLSISKAANDLIVVLDNISDPGNMGTLIRSSYGLGASAVVVVGDQSCDVWSPKVLRSSMGLHLRPEMPLIRSSWNDVHTTLQVVSRRGRNSNSVQIIIADAGEERICDDNRNDKAVDTNDDSSRSMDYVDHTEIDFTLYPSVLLVIGSEAVGASPAAYVNPTATGTWTDTSTSTSTSSSSSSSSASRDSGGGGGGGEEEGAVARVLCARIPMARTLESFNAAVAGSILLAEAARQRGPRSQHHHHHHDQQ